MLRQIPRPTQSDSLKLVLETYVLGHEKFELCDCIHDSARRSRPPHPVMAV